MRVFIQLVFAASLSSLQGFTIGSFQDFDDWPRAVGVPGTNAPQVISDNCKKDLLIVLDISYSIGRATFQDKVKPFLEKFVKDPNLNVGTQGTHIAMIVFSNTAKTKVLRNFGAKSTQKDVEAFIKSLDWNKLSGDRTRTGLALQMANDTIFPDDSPLNARPNVADVVMIITDGRPNGPGPQGREEQNAYDNADALKNKAVLVVGVAVGPQRLAFKTKIERMATSSSNTFDAEFDKLDTIMKNLVDASCQPFKPGDCDCANVASNPVYLRPGQTTVVVAWENPSLKCKNNRTPNTVSTVVSPTVASPHSFGVGQHKINYTFTFKDGFDIQCSVGINVTSCNCPRVSAVVAYLKPGSTRQTVSWTVPKPSCGGTLNSVKPAISPGHSFPIGQHTVTYVYKTSAGFDMKCSVNISVKACNCPSVCRKRVYVKPDYPTTSVSWVVPKPSCSDVQITKSSVTPNVSPGTSFPIGQHTVSYVYTMSAGFDLKCTVDIEVKVIPCQGRDYNPSTQICCSGKVWSTKPGWKCCGKKYYDASREKCCPLFYNLVPLTTDCPEGVKEVCG